MTVKENSVNMDSSSYNRGTIIKQMPHEEVNTAMNWRPIIDAFNNGRARDISDEPKVHDIPCIVVGSGPSLDYSIRFLKDWKGGIFCTTSQATTLIAHGIEPTHIVALDPFCRYEEIAGVHWEKTRTKLIAHPSCYPSLIEKWPNEMLLYIQNNGTKDSFYATTQKRMYSHREGDLRNPEFHYYIRTEITIFANSPPMQAFCAQTLGYNTCFLCGVDYAFPGGNERFTEYFPDGELDENHMGKWKVTPHPIKEGDVNAESSNGIPTHTIHLYYKKNFITAWRLSGQTMYTTDHGAMDIIPYADIEMVVKRQGDKKHYRKQTPEFIERVTERYLCTMKSYVIKVGNAYSFVEMPHPNELDGLNQYMRLLYNKYTCNNCGIVLQARDDLSSYPVDHDGETCTQCKKGTIYHSVDIDISANMERFKKLIAWRDSGDKQSKNTM